MKKLKNRFYRFAWNLHDRTRTFLCGSLGIVVAGLLFEWLGWEKACIVGWIVGVGSYLFLLGIVIISADGQRTQQRISQEDPNSLSLLILLVIIALLSNIFVGIILTAVGSRSHGNSQILIGLSVIGVLLSWCLLNTSFGQQYARVYYDVADEQGQPFSDGLRKGFAFPGTEQPAYLDFIYVAYTIALTYAMSDVSLESHYLRKIVLIHSLISFFFYSLILGSVLNAIVTS